MKKFLIKSMIILVALAVLISSLYAQIRYNFNDYQIYYYIHSPKIDKSLTPIIVAQYLETVATPKRDYNGQFTYVTDGINIISYDSGKN